MTRYDPSAKKGYYQKNRAARLAYQKDYDNKPKVKKKKQGYQRNYYHLRKKNPKFMKERRERSREYRAKNMRAETVILLQKHLRAVKVICPACKKRVTSEDAKRAVIALCPPPNIWHSKCALRDLLDKASKLLFVSPELAKSKLAKSIGRIGRK